MDDRPGVRRSPRFLPASTEEFVTPPESIDCQTESATMSTANSHITTTVEQTSADAIIYTTATNAVSTINMGQNIVTTPSEQEGIIAGMQKRIQDLEKMLKDSLTFPITHLPSNMHLPTPPPTAQSVPHVSLAALHAAPKVSQPAFLASAEQLPFSTMSFSSPPSLKALPGQLPPKSSQHVSLPPQQRSTELDLPRQNQPFQFKSFNGNTQYHDSPATTVQSSPNMNFNAVNSVYNDPTYTTTNINNSHSFDDHVQTNVNMQQFQPSTIDYRRPYLTPRKLLDLPQFGGEPEIWPMFSVAYYQSTNEYGYSDFENCQRLQKSLKGKAFETVKSLLIHPRNVSAVMDQLKIYYGRPEQLVASQLRDIKEVQPISDTAVNKFISYAAKVKNLSVFLQSAGAEQHLANPILIEELVSKLSLNKRIEWAKYSIAIKPYPSVLEFTNWINENAAILSRISETRPEHPDSKKRAVMCTAVASDKTQNVCFLCGGDHRLYKCEKFIEKTVYDRWLDVKKFKLCFACLGKGHSSRDCKRKRECSYAGCKRTHNKLLHENIDSKETIAKPNGLSSTSSQAVLNCATNDRAPKLLFRVVPITLYGPKSTVSSYALLDDGSSVSLIDKSLMMELGLDGKSSSLSLQWISGRSAENTTTIVNVLISGNNKNEKHLLKDLHAIEKLSLPLQSFSMSHLNKFSPIISSLPIEEYTNARPRVLIGLDNYHLGLATETIQLHHDGPFLTNTKLGWTIFGKMLHGSAPPTCLHMCKTEGQSLNDLMSEYFSTENFGVRPAPIVEGDDDARARRILDSSTQLADGRFQVGLLWKEDNIVLPDSLPMALKRLYNIEKKMNRDPEFAAEYKKAISSYIKKGYARKLTTSEIEEVKPHIWYLPHFAVVNPNKPRKLRLVFDATATVNGVSLNTFLLKGPQEYQPLPSVIFRFRLGQIGVCADIREMFHQILIQPADRCAQRFLWRDGCQERPPEVYEMLVMTFGAACSPCAAQYVKVENAKKHIEHDPRAIDAILRNHYVDDFVDSFLSKQHAIQIAKQVKEIHADAGFELRGFISNSKEVMQILNESLETEFGARELASEKVLGMYWFPENDSFRFRLKFNKVEDDVVCGKRVPTKRELLSIVMSVFDPLGCLGHLMIVAKLIMREVWRCNIQWDEAIPNHINTVWLEWKKDLDKVNGIAIPRHYFVTGNSKDTDLHIFVDASESAFAAVAYWRYFDENNAAQTSFICSKSRCAPMKKPSVPRMELQAAVLGVRLMQTIIQEHGLQVNRVTLWSDSTTVIKWIQSSNRRYKQFVAHRINEILDATKTENWRWVPTQLNVADEATKLRNNIDMNSNSKWFTGPDFLKEDSELWPNYCADQQQKGIEDDVEIVKKFTFVITCPNVIDINRFSTYLKIKRTVAWIVRFMNSLRGITPERNVLSMSELKRAEEWLVRYAQIVSYSEEMSVVENNESLSKDSVLRNLAPFKDKNGVLRVGGRLNAATWLPYDVKHPMILHPEHSLTKLIVKHYHEGMKHQNCEATIAEIRQKFWVPRIRQVLKKVVGNCMICRIERSKPVPPMMGRLPPDRLTPYVRPFTYTGLDYFGPINITIGRKQEKRWVALFTCLTIRAVHLEVAFDLSTDACILAIRNFMNRRGTPIRMRSDNGKNFVGLERDPKRFSEVFDCDRINDELSSKNVEWIFNCPLNPSEGGIWERMVRSVKRVLKQTMHLQAPREHTLQSFLIEAENIVNSRPLTYVPLSSYDEDPITPNHFLLGVANTAQTPAIDDVNSHPKVLRKQWRIARQLRDHFWKKWISDYLPILTRREKWCEPSRLIEVGDLVLICDVSISRKDWTKGIVQRVFPGKDGIIRRAEVRTTHGFLNRPVSKLAVIDVVSGESD